MLAVQSKHNDTKAVGEQLWNPARILLYIFTLFFRFFILSQPGLQPSLTGEKCWTK